MYDEVVYIRSYLRHTRSVQTEFSVTRRIGYFKIVECYFRLKYSAI